ncbi:putative aspartoacylase [Fibrobacterales bacterium]|nr:putative aspartoacylase [Fibrobacterales bacterium]
MGKVVVVGGTHGNELTGVYLAKKYGWLIANPKAAELSKRYVDEDLNRCFAMSKLSDSHTKQSDCGSSLRGALAANQSKDGTQKSYELRRAQEINEILGVKGSANSPDLILDIHNTTANMGITLILSARDEFLLKIAAIIASEFTGIHIYLQPEERAESPYLGTIAKRDICIEAGSQVHGTLNAKLFLEVEAVVLRILELANTDFLACQTLQHCTGGSTIVISLPVYTETCNVDYPRDENGNITAMIHPNLQGKDFCELKKAMPVFLSFDGKEILWEGEDCYPAFINEQAYYEKGIAMSLTKREILEFNLIK